jgi:hypothetical protein
MVAVATTMPRIATVATMIMPLTGTLAAAKSMAAAATKSVVIDDPDYAQYKLKKIF